MNWELQMEASFTIDALSPEFIFGGLKGEIIDYVISSYRVNLNLIYLYYWHPALQIHCQEIYGGIGNEPFVHLHRPEKPGIYHAKFILITTTEVLKFIVMTTNITEEIIKNCMNDYYVIVTPKEKLSSPTLFTTKLYQFFDFYNIKLKAGLLQYQWKGLKSRLLLSIPGKTSHGICFHEQVKLPKRNSETSAIIRCSTLMTGYDIKKVFHVKRCIVEYMEKQEGIPIHGIYKLETNKEVDGKERYELQPFRTEKPFHYKRYIIQYKGKKLTRQYLIITSANLSRQAWGTSKYAAANAELGIVWNSEFTFN